MNRIKWKGDMNEMNKMENVDIEYLEYIERKKNINERIRKFAFRSTKSIFFFMSILLAVLLTYCYCNWETIYKSPQSENPLLNLILLSAVIGVFIFISFIALVFDDYKEKKKHE
jgi:uncharacterized integral membrane protein